VALLACYRIPDFSKFSGQDELSTMEHVSGFIAQATCEDAFKVQFFPLSLFGPAFTWFASLAPDSITGWADLEKKFHKYFYTSTREMRLTDLTNLRMRNNESVHEFVQRF
jgi:hypothetical protein